MCIYWKNSGSDWIATKSIAQRENELRSNLVDAQAYARELIKEYSKNDAARRKALTKSKSDRKRIKDQQTLHKIILEKLSAQLAIVQARNTAAIEKAEKTDAALESNIQSENSAQSQFDERKSALDMEKSLSALRIDNSKSEIDKHFTRKALDAQQLLQDRLMQESKDKLDKLQISGDEASSKFDKSSAKKTSYKEKFKNFLKNFKISDKYSLDRVRDPRVAVVSTIDINDE